MYRLTPELREFITTMVFKIDTREYNEMLYKIMRAGEYTRVESIRLNELRFKYIQSKQNGIT